MVPFVPWDKFLTMFRWEQGEHVTLVGHSGSGKSTLGLSLLPYRKYVTVVVTKPRDPILSKFRKQGYRIVREWPPPEDATKVVFWPPIEKSENLETQRVDVAKCLRDIYTTGGWCVYVDEGTYVSDFLGLAQELRLLWLQGRAMGVSLVTGAQRPRYLPLEAYSQSTHLFLWVANDRYDVKRLAEIGGAVAPTVQSVIPTLAKHECLYVNTRDGELLRTNVRTRMKRKDRNK